MIYYIILFVILVTILVVKLIEFVHLPHEKFRKYIKMVAFILILLVILFSVRFFPAVITAIPGVLLIFYRWQFIISLISKFLIFKQSKRGNFKKTMTRKEALEILGLKDEATKREILDSYNNLIKKNHPDLGGSDWITKRLNQARETLLG